MTVHSPLGGVPDLESGWSGTSPRLAYHLFVPKRVTPDAPLLVAVHGYSRNALEQAERFAPACERWGHVLVAPHFDQDQFPDFQRLGRRGHGARADLALAALVTSLRQRLGMLFGRVRLFGYSGGGQFAHRYLMAYPHRVESAVIAAPGWYTFPDPTVNYPAGIRIGGKLSDVRMVPESFLRIPVLVIVGDRDDDEQGENLRRSEGLDLQQGVTRLERAERWTAAMNGAAAQLGFPPRVRFETLAGAGHSFAECADLGLAERVFGFFEGGSRS